MEKPAFDPGLTQQFTAPYRRVINKDGSFNVHRRGGNWHDVHPYLHLVNLGWPAFLATLFLGYVLVNTLFATVYFILGPDQIAGTGAATAAGRFLKIFFFSAQTLSTVGYGTMAPKGNAANVVASLEALAGVLGFAVATGLLFGRVSRPSAKIIQFQRADRALPGRHQPAIPCREPPPQRPDGTGGARHVNDRRKPQ